MGDASWQRFCHYLFYSDELGMQIDISKIRFTDNYFQYMETGMKAIYQKIRELESGFIYNPDEGRMVGHYWLRRPELAPNSMIRQEIESTIKGIKDFTAEIHAGLLTGENGQVFKNVLVIGIGGSSLGPRFLAHALKQSTDKMRLFFIDNTDPDGIDCILEQIGSELDQTLTIVISKSGGTIETRNGMEEVREYYKRSGLQFPRHAVSITQKGSSLDRLQAVENWLKMFPLWDWVGGRTSVFSAVGLLPLALQGINIERLLEGAEKCDRLTRLDETPKNPAALLALMWYAVTNGQGGKQMVVLPYKDRLQLLAMYLQQLIMESLGKEKDLDGKFVQQGITVYGNKGSTDQHSYLQQLLDGPDNFFITFIEILKDRQKKSIKLAENSTSGDYLQAFLLGTRKALMLKGRQFITITLNEINEKSLGALIALFERTVSIYALLINVNAYHQPAVELGKKQTGEVIALKNRVSEFLAQNRKNKYTLQMLAEELGNGVDKEILYKILQHLVHNPDSNIAAVKTKNQDNRLVFEYFFYAEQS